MTENVRVRFRFGPVEIEYEGTDSLFPQDLLTFLGDAVALCAERDVPATPETPPSDSGHGVPPILPTRDDLSVSSIAARMNAETGADLIMAAAVFLAECAGQPVFSRREILDTMKGSTAHYNKNMSSNLTSYLRGLVKGGRLNERTDGFYALTANEKQATEAILAPDI